MATRFMPGLFDAREPRQFTRQPILLPARLVTTTEEYAVRLLDISSGGARISGEELPSTGADVLLKRDGFETFGAIVWSANGQAGVEFEEPIDEAAFRSSHGVAVASAERVAGGIGFGRKVSGHPRLSTGAGWIDS